VLADDNFASITAAVREGRTVYNNIEKAILFLLPTNVAQALVIMVAIFAGFIMPITATQILWVNMVTSVALGLVISFEPHERDAAALLSTVRRAGPASIFKPPVMTVMPSKNKPTPPRIEIVIDIRALLG
jgi:magnesium-transporting ATPase (P-type)